MRALIIAALVAATPFCSRAASPGFDEGVAAGRLIACAAPPRHVAFFWRLQEARAPGDIQSFSMFFLAGLMAGQTERPRPDDCVRMLRRLREEFGEP